MQVKPPLLEDSVACFECKVVETTKAPDHTLFIGEVLTAHVSDKKDKIYNYGDRQLFLWSLEEKQSVVKTKNAK